MKAVFLDRDGTIGGDGHGIHPVEFKMFDFAPEAIKRLNDCGIKVFLFTNQTRVGRGYFTESELLQGFAVMEKELNTYSSYLDGIYYCPHHPDENCGCQKPKTGLLERVQQEHQLDLSQCFVVGDTGGSDMLAASRVGARKVLVRTGWGENSLTKYRNHWSDVEPDYIAEDLLDAADWIKRELEKG